MKAQQGDCEGKEDVMGKRYEPVESCNFRNQWFFKLHNEFVWEKGNTASIFHWKRCAFSVGG